MSMLKSWFQAPNKTPFWLPPEDAEGGESSSRSSRVPSPSLSRSPNSVSSRSHGVPAENAFTPFERSESAVRRQIQTLLDAQAEGLTRGLGQQDVGGSSLEASSLQASSLTRNGKVTPIRQPVNKPITLRAARRGIEVAMLELGTIKDRELDACKSEIVRAEATLHKASKFETRQTELWRAMNTIEHSEDRQRRDQLQADDLALQEQINILEAQLARLNDEQKAIKLQLSGVKNTVDAKLSSYQESIKILESEMATFLRDQRTPSTLEEDSFLSLPPKRRTIKMAMDHAIKEKEVIQSRQAKFEAEREAIGEGLALWKETVEAVAHFEKSLHQDIENLQPDASGADDSNQRLEGLLRQMDIVLHDLDSRVKLAETRGWKLLVCCIGAELEAFNQGKDMLEGLAEMQGQGERLNSYEEVESVESATSPAVERSNQFEEPLRGSVSTIKRFRDDRKKFRTTGQSDEEPDPELLMTARSDTDTD